MSGGIHSTSLNQPIGGPKHHAGAAILTGLAVTFFVFGFWTRSASQHGGQPDVRISSDSPAMSLEAEASSESIPGVHAARPPLGAAAPFALILLAIAVLPLWKPTVHWWEHNRNKLLVSGLLGGVTLGYYLCAHGLSATVTVIDHAVLKEYIPFMTVLLALYVISGGISLTGDLPAHPVTNTAFLAVGTLLASFIGTTGASMLLIRPLLQTNSERRHTVHTVVFFIFLVSNIGGALLPIGDPPLFLGFLKGVPFFWTLKLWPIWLLTSAVLLAVYFVWDTIAYRRETPPDVMRDELVRIPLRISGLLNVVWLVAVVLVTATIEPGRILAGVTAFPFLREAVLLLLAVFSLKLTPPAARKNNQFNYTAILEVAALFIGIFICMQPPVEILRASGPSLAAVLDSPARIFWATGLLSSFLDNAPTYAILLESATALTPSGGVGTVALSGGGNVAESLLIGVSLGAVFMGANTYIGNGPNFMVKSIAEQRGVRMPSFFGFMLYSAGILVPWFVVLTWLFLRK